MSVRRWVGLGAKLAVPVLAVGVLGYALVDPQPALGAAGASAAAAAARRPPRPVPVDTAQLVCPGPETIGVRGAADAGADGKGQALTPVRVATAAAPAAVRPSDGSAPGRGVVALRTPSDVVATQAARADAGAFVQGTSAGPTWVTAVATGTAAPGLVAEQVSAVTSGDLRGLVSATCLAAGDDLWLVGGGTDVGRRGRLVLSNPQASTADVSVDVLSADGPVARTPGSTVALAPHSRTVLLLDALAPDARSPVVRVRSDGGAIGAVLSDTWLQGTTPRGNDDVVASLPPSRRVLVPGVRVDGGAALRIAVPGTSEAVAQVRVLGPKGEVDLPDDGVVRVPAGSVRDVDLESLPAGAYGVEVTADVPVVAGAVVQRRSGGDPGDFAWSASSDVITSLAGLAQTDPSGGASTDLVLTAPRRTAVADVVTVKPDGTTSTTTVSVPAGTTQVVAAAAGASVWLRPQPGSGQLVAARFEQLAAEHGTLVTTGPLRQVTLTRVPAVLVPADD